MGVGAGPCARPDRSMGFGWGDTGSGEPGRGGRRGATTRGSPLRAERRKFRRFCLTAGGGGCILCDEHSGIFIGWDDEAIVDNAL